MTISNMFIMDLKGKVIISRNYRGDVPMNASDRFANYIQERDEMEQRPIFTDGGLTFAFIKVAKSMQVNKKGRPSITGQ